MKKISKCVIGIIAVLVVNVVSICANINCVYAYTYAGIDKTEISKRNIFRNRENEYKNVDKKVKKEKQKHSTVAKKEVEKYLNDNGVFDEDINGLFSEDELKKLDINEVKNSEIYISYYAVEDKEELKDTPIEENEMIELSDEQINEYLGEKYFSEKTNLLDELEKEFETRREKEDKAYIDKFLEAIGVKPIDAYASTIKDSDSIGGIDDLHNPSMLKKVWVISKDSSCKFIKVRLQAIWTKMPKYRSLDSVVVAWDYASYYPCEGKYSKVVVTHFWDEQIKYNDGTKRVYSPIRQSKTMKSVGGQYSVKNNQYHVNEKNIVAAIDLHDDYEGYDSKTMTDISTCYLNEGITFTFYVKPKYKKVNFNLHYIHIKVKYNMISVAFDLAGGKVGMLSAFYTWASGSNKNVSCELSGVDEEIPFIWK